MLDFNERTTPVSPQIIEALQNYLANNRLQAYPEYGDFLKELSTYTAVAENELMITNGSDQGIELVFRAVTSPGDEAIVPLPTFAMFEQAAAASELKVISPSYTADFKYPTKEVLAAINDKTRVITICTPNNPTGTLTSVEEILEIAKAAPQAAVLVDECYFEYSNTTVKDYINEYQNIFITRTFSKTWGLSALRLGYLISSAENIENLLKIRGPYDMNTPSIVAARAALKDPSYMKDYVKEVLEVSLPLFLSFLDKKAIRYWPTAANYVLLYPKDPEKLVRSLEEKDILVRPRSGPGIDNTVRITLGTKEQTERLIDILEDIL